MNIKEVTMRGLIVLASGAVLASCTMSTEAPAPSLQAQTKAQQLLAGKVALAPISCIPARKANDFVVIDENTLAYKDGTSRVYINHTNGSCAQASQGHTALVSRQTGQEGPCSGDVVQVVDTLSHQTIGSCALGEFTPYVRQGA
jgi:hypothetical protein